jgi:hypothetical protein
VDSDEREEERRLLAELETVLSHLERTMTLHQTSTEEWRQRREELAALRHKVQVFRARLGRDKR